jgi:hypothetical protein
MCEANNHLDHPDRVFKVIQGARHVQHNQTIQDLAVIPRYIWRKSWETLYSRYLELSSGNIPSDIETMKENIAGLNKADFQCRFRVWNNRSCRASVQTGTEVAREQSPTLQPSQEVKKRTHPEDLQHNMGLSNIGLKKAFDQIGSELTAEEGLTMQTRPHAFTRESDNTSIKQNRQTSMSEMRRVFDRNFARDESVAAQADQQSKRQELGRTGHIARI